MSLRYGSQTQIRYAPIWLFRLESIGGSTGIYLAGISCVQQAKQASMGFGLQTERETDIGGEAHRGVCIARNAET